jgi:hypothetical protein
MTDPSLPCFARSTTSLAEVMRVPAYVAPLEGRRLAAGAGRLAGIASGGVGDDLAVAERLVSNGELEHA